MARPRCLALSVSDAAEDVIGVIRAGARGYITEQEATRNILTAVRRVLGGGIYLNERAAAHLLTRLVGSQKPGLAGPGELLADRELQVFSLIGRGFGASRLATELHLSVKTVETYQANIKQKLGLRSAAELSAKATHWTLNSMRRNAQLRKLVKTAA